MVMVTATALVGREIYDVNKELAGSIEDIMINVHTGVIDYVVVAFGGVLGIGTKLFAIPFHEFLIDTNDDVVIQRDKAYLKQSPGFEKDHWPLTNASRDPYFDDVDKHFKKPVRLFNLP